jgi:hypothetical protein
MLSLDMVILLMSMGARHIVSYSYLGKKGIKLLVLPSLVGLHDHYLGVELALYHVLEFSKLLKHFRFKMKKVYSSKFTEIIDETYIVFLPTY